MPATNPWTTVSPPRIPYRYSRALVADPDLPGTVLFTQGAELYQRDLWRWDGAGFTHLAGGVFPSYRLADQLHGIFACHDPVRSDTLLFGAVGHRPTADAPMAPTGVVMASLRDPTAERVLTHPPGLAVPFCMCAAFRAGAHLLLLGRDGTLLGVPAAGDTLTLVADRLAALVAAEIELTTAAADPDRGIVVATADDRTGRLFTWTAESGWQEGAATGAAANKLVWNSVDRRIDMLDAEERIRPFDRAAGSRWSGYPRQEELVRVATDDTWLLLTRDGEPRVARAQQGDGQTPVQFEEVRVPWANYEPIDGYVRATATSGSEPWLLPKGYSPLQRLDGDRWVTVAQKIGWERLAAATPHGLAVTERGSALALIDRSGGRHQLAGPDRRINGRVGDDSQLCWDEAGEQLLLWRGRKGETWVHRAGQWHQLAGDRPPHGPALLCAAPAGVYAVAGGELWLLHADAWRKLGEGVSPSTQSIFWSSRCGGLWSVSPAGVGAWREGSFAPVTPLPPGYELLRPAPPGTTIFFDTRGMVIFDPVSQQLLAYGGGGSWRLDLASCAASGGRPTSP